MLNKYLVLYRTHLQRTSHKLLTDFVNTPVRVTSTPLEQNRNLNIIYQNLLNLELTFKIDQMLAPEGMI